MTTKIAQRSRFIYQIKLFGHYILYHVIAKNSTDAREQLTKFFKKDGHSTGAIAAMQASLTLINVTDI